MKTIAVQEGFGHLRVELEELGYTVLPHSKEELEADVVIGAVGLRNEFGCSLDDEHEKTLYINGEDLTVEEIDRIIKKTECK